ncbi:MAG: hypothetical protein WCI62_04405 [Erysipelotrichaceae bacterium]
MIVKDILALTQWTNLNDEALDNSIEGVICGDLLSYVMGHGSMNQVWVTMQTHQNIIAIAALKEFACIILIDDNTLELDVLESAKKNHISVITSPLSAFETIRSLIQIGL